MRAYIKFFLSVIIIIIISTMAFSAIINDDKTGESSNEGEVSDEELQELEDNGGVKDVEPENVEKTSDGNYRITEGGYTKNGVQREGKNIVVNSQGEVIRADTLDVDGNHFENVEDFQRNGEGEYYIGSAERLKDGNRRLVSGKVIIGKNNGMEAEQADNIMQQDAVVNMVTGYSSSGNRFSLDTAKSVFFENMSLSDIKNSSFETDNGELVKASVTSAVDNNSFEIDDVKITLDKDESFNLTKKPNGKYKVGIDSGNGTVEDRYGNVACADISAGSRYRYVGEDYDPFGLYIPSDAENFNLCIRTKADEQYPTNCSQCGVMDFINQSFELNGQYEYEKKDAVDPRLFTDVIKADGNFSANLSENAENITYLYPDNGRVFSNIFEVKYWEEDKGFRFAGFNKPYTIHEIYPNIKITEQRLIYTAPRNEFIMHKDMGFWT